MCGFFLHAAGNAANPRFLALLVLNPGVLLRSPLPLVGHNFKRGKKACCNHCSKGGATFTCDECNFSVHEDCKAAVITPCRTAEEDALLWSAPPLSDRPSDRPSPFNDERAFIRSAESSESSIVHRYNVYCKPTLHRSPTRRPRRPFAALSLRSCSRAFSRSSLCVSASGTRVRDTALSSTGGRWLKTRRNTFATSAETASGSANQSSCARAAGSGSTRSAGNRPSTTAVRWSASW